jgi:hypothetical protein
VIIAIYIKNNIIQSSHEKMASMLEELVRKYEKKYVEK